MQSAPPTADNAAAQVAIQEETTVVATLLTALTVLVSALLGTVLRIRCEARGMDWLLRFKCSPVHQTRAMLTPRHSTRQLMTSCGVASALGLLVGGAALVAAWASGDFTLLRRLAFDPAAFMTFLLPPLIMNAGLAVQQSFFFCLIGPISLLGVLGTLLNCLVLAAGVSFAGSFGGYQLSRRDCLAIGAIFGATDTVATLQVLSSTAAPALFALVLGEGCINDAMSLVLLRALAPDGSATTSLMSTLARFIYLLVASSTLGFVVGIAACAIARYVNVRLSNVSGDSVELEVATLSLVAYLAFLLAESIGLSGILSLFIAALAISYYGLRCLSREARTTMLRASSALSFLSEQTIFVYTGAAMMDRTVWALARPGEVAALVSVLGALLLASRAVTVAALTAVGNWLQGVPSAHRISYREAAVVWWAGSLRGAVSVAIATHHFAVVAPGRAAMYLPQPKEIAEKEVLRTRASVIASTLTVVLLSTTLFNAATRPFLLHVLPGAVTAAEGENGACATRPLANADDLSNARGEEHETSWLYRIWRGMDERYLAPLLLQVPPSDRQQSMYTELQ